MQTPYGSNSVHGNHEISHISYLDFLKFDTRIVELFKLGYSGSKFSAKLRNPEFIHRLYLERNDAYMGYLSAFKERFAGYDAIVMNPGVDLVHPEYLWKHFPNSLKCLHFVDDPHTTYSYGLPFAWAFDCATYISPSYTEDFNMGEILNHAGFKQTKWFPHCVSNVNAAIYSVDQLERNLRTRENKVVYIGGFYTGKNSRLLRLKHKLKRDLDIFGRYPLLGLSFSLMSLISDTPVFYRVKTLTSTERECIYSRYAIGVNMHLSVPGRETGNARLYELAYRGVAQVCDAGGSSLVSNIFEPEKEILLYENEDECVKQIRRLMKDSEYRIQLALNAYVRATSEYAYEPRLLELINWFQRVQRERART
jgi:hypothetical protein